MWGGGDDAVLVVGMVTGCVGGGRHQQCPWGERGSIVVVAVVVAVVDD